jgi:GrpB-like predicted nucleotidyltransferase (UPF0157 family)
MDTRDLDADPGRLLIGGRENREIVLVEYDPSWPTRYRQERDRVRHALGASGGRVEHIGSTAVPGLAAKPIIDLLATVADPAEDSALVPALEAVGYELRVREPRHRMFRTPELDVHVHIWGHSDPEVERHIRFRDRLRQDPEARSAYEALKRKLAKRDWADMNEYADAKAAMIEATLARAD